MSRKILAGAPRSPVNRETFRGPIGPAVDSREPTPFARGSLPDGPWRDPQPSRPEVRSLAEASRCKVLLADDHSIVRHALRLLLEREGLEVVGEAANGQAAVRLARELRPDIAVLDLMMPVLNGIDAAREILQACPETLPVLLVASATEEQVLQAMRAGIRGCVLKSHEATELIRAIGEVRRGGVYLSPGHSRSVVEAYVGRRDLPPDPLSPRERQVLQLVAEGKSTKEAANLLCISVKTVESHRCRIMSKLEIRETASLVRYAIRHGLSEL